VDGSYWVYQYDSLGQVTSGHKHFRDNSPVPGQEFDYSFDTIGNRTQTLAGGDQNGANQRAANYSVNNLNQITSRQYPGTADVIGAALATNAVTVNGQTAWRKAEYFWSSINLNNSGSAQWQTPTIVSANYNASGGIYAPSTPEQFSYDLDGNLTTDGRWNYTWDGENRLKSMTVNTSAGPQYQLTFVYDAKGRRIQKNVAEYNGSAYVMQTTADFLCDGWNLIAMLNSQSLILNSFVWGNDLSGSMQGAGGVGGLLEVGYFGAAPTNCFIAFDGNGNVAALINAADGTVAANYEYGPFGEVIRATGPMAKVNPMRFSTKYQDDESDLLYYGYRYYKPSTGTWLSRDPESEVAGLNLYGFSGNNPVMYVDSLGCDYSTIVAYSVRITYFKHYCGSYVCTGFSIGGGLGGPTVGWPFSIQWRLVSQEGPITTDESKFLPNGWTWSGPPQEVGRQFYNTSNDTGVGCSNWEIGRTDVELTKINYKRKATHQ
jgi:RHS repeat-associated protein